MNNREAVIGWKDLPIDLVLEIVQFVSNESPLNSSGKAQHALQCLEFDRSTRCGVLAHPHRLVVSQTIRDEFKGLHPLTSSVWSSSLPPRLQISLPFQKKFAKVKLISQNFWSDVRISSDRFAL